MAWALFSVSVKILNNEKKNKQAWFLINSLNHSLLL